MLFLEANTVKETSGSCTKNDIGGKITKHLALKTGSIKILEDYFFIGNLKLSFPA